MAANWANRTVWTEDCLYVLRGMNSESVDLIYLDPPFNSKANYAAPHRLEGGRRGVQGHLEPVGCRRRVVVER